MFTQTKYLFTGFFLLSLFSANIFAANDTTSALRGETNVGSATVELTHIPTGITKTSSSDENGVFSIGNLRPGGPYKITVSKAGYVTETLNDVYLSVSETARLTVGLAADGDMDDVTVVGTKSARIQTSLAVTAEDIENIPSIERSISDYVKKDSRIFVEGTSRNATISVSGTNNRYNNFTVDGIEQNDQLGLNANGFPSVRNPISIETIAQIQVDISPFDVSKGNFTGASINAVTKSGTNEFKGSYYSYNTDEDNVGKLNGQKASQFEDSTEGFVIGGPIIKDKLFFFGSYEEFESVTPAEPYTYRIATQALIDEIASQTQALYGYNPGTTSFLPPPEKAEKEMYKLDYYINENHRLEYVYSFSEDNTVRPYNYDIRFSSHYYNYPAMTEKDTYAYYGDISDNLYVQAKYSEVEWANDQDALGGEDFPHVEIRITAPDGSYTSGNRESIFLGPDKYRSANEGFAFDEILNLKAVYTMGDHEITVGYDSIDKELGNLFISRENGAYQFKGVDNYYAGIPSFFRFNKSATGDPYYAMAGFSGTFETLYVQDKYYVSDILTVNYGLRYDSFDMDSGPAYNEYGSGLLGFRNDTPASTSILQPRFGFQLDATNLDMFSSDRIVAAELRGGYGLFAGLNYTVNWFPNSPTKFSLFYKAYSGKRFSYVFDGIDDGYDDGNTLLYIPTLNDPNVVYSGVTEAEVLEVVQGIGTPGSHVAANSGQVPWTRSLDLRVSQEIPMPVLDHKLFVYFDVLNVLNLINEDKGHAYYQRYSSRQVLDSDGLDSQGRIIITGTDDRGASIDTYASRYRMQLGFVYKF